MLSQVLPVGGINAGDFSHEPRCVAAVAAAVLPVYLEAGGPVVADVPVPPGNCHSTFPIGAIDPLQQIAVPVVSPSVVASEIIRIPIRSPVFPGINAHTVVQRFDVLQGIDVLGSIAAAVMEILPLMHISLMLSLTSSASFLVYSASSCVTTVYSVPPTIIFTLFFTPFTPHQFTIRFYYITFW